MEKIVGKRISSIDVAKGLGILIVVLGHILGESDFFLEKLIFSFHMPLFFILSGFVLKISNEKQKLNDILRSETKLIAAYIFYAVLYIIFNIPINIVGEHNTWNQVLSKVYQLVMFYGRSIVVFACISNFTYRL